MSGAHPSSMAADPHSGGPQIAATLPARQVHKGLRLVALFEAVKGTLGLAVAIGALLLSQRDLQQFAESIVYGLRLDPAAHYTSLFIREASLVTPRDLGRVAAGLMAYALFRFGESFGLWRGYAWAEWLAVVSGAIYIPFELGSIFRRFTWFKLSVLGLNILIVVYVALILTRSRPKEPLPAPGNIGPPAGGNV
jgi:uncharacterized membrane protein (DUF2068 family)